MGLTFKITWCSFEIVLLCKTAVSVHIAAPGPPFYISANFTGKIGTSL